MHMPARERPLYIMPSITAARSSPACSVGKAACQTSRHRNRGVETSIYNGTLKAIDDGVPVECAAVLVDEQFGAAILADAHKRGLTTACPVEKSGQAEFDSEYGESFAQHIEGMTIGDSRIADVVTFVADRRNASGSPTSRATTEPSSTEQPAAWRRGCFSSPALVPASDGALLLRGSTTSCRSPESHPPVPLALRAPSLAGKCGGYGARILWRAAQAERPLLAG